MPSTTASDARLFFALWPAPTVRDALVAWARDHAPPRTRPVRPENLHLTLAFLGRLPDEGLASARAAGAALRAEPVRLDLARVEHWARPRLLCAVPAPGPDPLGTLARALRAVLVAHHLPVESRPFRSHVTLVRKVGGPWPARALAPPLAWSGVAIALVASEPGRDGVRYREVASWPLRGNA